MYNIISMKLVKNVQNKDIYENILILVKLKFLWNKSIILK